MATNYTFAQAVKIIAEGKDLEAIMDIGRRYPILMNKVTKVAAKAGDDFVDLMSKMPDYLTANKVNSALKPVDDSDDGDEATEEAEEQKTEKPKREKKEKAEKKEKKPKDDDEAEEAGTDYSEMSAMELFKECKKRGIKAEPKQKAAAYVKLLKAADAKADDTESDDDWDDGEEETKTAKKASKKEDKKPAKKSESDDEDWDI